MGELSLDALRNYLRQHDIDLATCINKIIIKVSDEHDKGYAKPLKYFLDYVDDERHFLLDGKWHVFNENYIEFLKKQIDEHITIDAPGIDFSNTEYDRWRSTLSEEEKNTPSYAEYYFNTHREADGYMNMDRDITTLKQQYKIEKLDLYKDNTAFFVKIGTPQKLGYAIDQAMATIKILQSRTSAIQHNGTVIKPKKICLWLILERQTALTKISEIKSLIFLMKLAEWQRQCSNAGYEPIVRISYRRD